MKLLQREWRVAFSPRVQPVWLRLIKWAVLILTIVRYRQRPWFGYAFGVALLGGITLHFFYRWKTQGWRRPWGGWSDLEVNA
jgi:hypothetical protein